ncbi:MAG: oxidative stress defense protein [Candidatus Hamiltonella defensa (Ceratovacuna japonica)]
MKLHQLIHSFIVLFSLFPIMSKADQWPSGPYVATSGIANVEAIPDIANLIINVNILAKDAADAKKQVDHRVNQYFDFLEKNQVDQKDIHAANLITEPEYDYQKEGKTLLKGYRAIREVKVQLRQMDKLNTLLDQALKLGLNEIRALKFSVADPDLYRKKAQQKAIENARQQAQLLAQSFQSILGPIYSVRYHGEAAYQPKPLLSTYKTENSISSDTALTYQKQRIQFTDQVDVVFELEKKH